MEAATTILNSGGKCCVVSGQFFRLIQVCEVIAGVDVVCTV